MSWVHRIEQVDKTGLTGLCANCGPVELKYRASGNRYVCKTGYLDQSRAYDARRRPKVIGLCVICRRTVRLYYDHDHNTGKFRGRICNDCNVLIGYAKDSVRILKGAARYLEQANLPKE